MPPLNGCSNSSIDVVEATRETCPWNIAGEASSALGMVPSCHAGLSEGVPPSGVRVTRAESSMRETAFVSWLASIDTESVSDAGSSNTVLAVTIALLVLGVGLLAVTVWFWRVTRPDPDALGPLIAMSDRRFAALGPIEKRRVLDGARPKDPPGEVAPVVADAEPVPDDAHHESLDDNDNDPVVDDEPENVDEWDIDESADGLPELDDVDTTSRPIDPLL